ncbi:MAG: PilZ domain-containing protein [Acidobacteria bacterium]|nr:PilZ domain-containing protein [Acidobacteriota bacterium]
MTPPVTNTKPAAPASSVRPALQRQKTAEERRRAQRALLRISVTIHVAGKQPIQGYTHTVSATGAMIILNEPLPEGTKFTLENMKTSTKVDARVARAAQVTSEGSLVPVEFMTAAPIFWNVFFPPSVN